MFGFSFPSIPGLGGGLPGLGGGGGSSKIPGIGGGNLQGSPADVQRQSEAGAAADAKLKRENGLRDALAIEKQQSIDASSRAGAEIGSVYQLAKGGLISAMMPLFFTVGGFILIIFGFVLIVGKEEVINQVKKISAMAAEA